MSNSRILSPRWIRLSRVIRHTGPDEEDGYLVISSEISPEWKFVILVNDNVRTFPEWVTCLPLARIKRKAISWWVARGSLLLT